MKTRFEAVAKWFIDNRRNNDLTPYMTFDIKSYKTYEECLLSVKKEIKRRSRTEQPIYSYKIYKVCYEVVEETVIKD